MNLDFISYQMTRISNFKSVAIYQS